MESFFLSFLATFLAAVFLFFFTLVTKKGFSKHENQNTDRPMLPPGPRKLPIIGNLHQLVGSLPWCAFRDLSTKHGPIMHLKLGEVSAIIISSPGLAKEVMTTHDVALADRPEFFAGEYVFYNKHDIGLAPYGGYWRQMRKICTSELLSNKKVSKFSSIREEEASDLIKTIKLAAPKGSSINLTDKVFSLSSNVTCRTSFGKLFHGQEELMDLIRVQLDFLGAVMLADVFPSLKFLSVITGTKHKLVMMQKKADDVLDNIIYERQQHYRFLNTTQNSSKPPSSSEEEQEETLLDVLVRLQQDGGLEFPIKDINIKAILFQMFAGGSETSSTTIEWAFTEMIKNPRVMQKAQAEVRQVGEKNKTIYEADIEKLCYLNLVIKETLRLHPPSPLLLPRESREVCEIDGYVLPVKMKVIVNAWALGRDPDTWDDAESFIPERFENNPINFAGSNFEYIPFGAGRRICPGISFGVSIVELGLAKLLYHFDWKLPHGMNLVDLDMNETNGVTARRKNHLYLVPSLPAGVSS